MLRAAPIADFAMDVSCDCGNFSGDHT